jgi:hypothetical protein
MIDVLGPEKCRRHSVQSKSPLLSRALNPALPCRCSPDNMALLPVSGSCGVSRIRKDVSSLLPGEQVVPASEASAMKQINELLKEAVEYGQQKVDSTRALVATGW